ncbi:MAG TPA: TylF/MycF/NovP-related O-methyltransferase [Falsiroseomonas sp.]|nr:TylF/MycF/NovP-related O-methyltransferase [Falsiroseomonas sp.]
MQADLPSLFADAYVGPPHKRVEVLPLLHGFAFALLAARRGAPLAEPLQAAECGVYKGHSLASCARLALALGSRVAFTGLDTFAGLPALSETDLSYNPHEAARGPEPLFRDTSVAEVQGFIAEQAPGTEAQLVAGLFADTLDTLPERLYDFVHVDCDLYEPHLECLQYFYPRVRPGGIVFFDDYHSVEFPMARGAIDVFMSGRLEELMHLRCGEDRPNHTKAWFVKR